MSLLDNKYQINPNSPSSQDKDATQFIDRQGGSIGDSVTVGMSQKTADKVKSTLSGEGQVAKLKFNKDYSISDRDAALIVSTYERESVYKDSEEAALVTYYKDVYSTRNFSQRVQEQMAYYPGMHNSTGGPSDNMDNPFESNAERKAEIRMNKWDNALDSPDSFMSTLRQSVPVNENGEQAFDYKSIFGSDNSAKDKATEVGKMLTECIPCFDRLFDLDGLVPDGDLLEVHGLNIMLRLDILDKILDLFRNPGLFVDVCELLKLLSGLCPQDLLALLALLTQYLAKLNLDIRFNLDFIINLVGPILSPFLNALSQWLDKWVQMILAPILCITDHINETIYMFNTIKVAVKNTSIDLNLEGNSNIFGTTGFSGGGIKTNTGATVADGGSSWTNDEVYRFDTPADTKYKEFRPSWPSEEIEYSSDEMKEARNPSFSEAEREQRNKDIRSLSERKQKQSDALRKLPGSDKDIRSDGSRWSDDGTPLSEKTTVASFSKGMENHPSEDQSPPEEGPKYFDPSPLVNSIVQLRNIVQAAIRYVQDWFAYVIQMIYDLLGVDFGWLLKKNDTSFLKSNIIQLILMIKSIVEAIQKNGLRCGIHNNFDNPQMKFILENGLNQFSTGYTFSVMDNGDIEVIPPGSSTLPSVEDVSSALNKQQADKEAASSKNTSDQAQSPQDKLNEQTRQKTQESGIIVKNCLRDMTQEEIDQARQWISDYERRLGQNA